MRLSPLQEIAMLVGVAAFIMAAAWVLGGAVLPELDQPLGQLVSLGQTTVQR